MSDYRNPLRRFLFRKDFFRRVKQRLQGYRRRLVKCEITDLELLLKRENPKVVFDVGANVGFITSQLLRTFKTAEIYAFEPDPVPFATLRAVHGSDPRVHTFQMAASDKLGELNFVQRPLSCNSSLCQVANRPSNSSTTKTENQITVSVNTLDSFCLEHGIRHIDLLKVDTEGADLLVLKGAQKLLHDRCIDAVMFEVFFIPTYEGQSGLDEFYAFLKSYDFRFFNIYHGRETLRAQVCYANVIFIGPRLQQMLDAKAPRT